MNLFMKHYSPDWTFQGLCLIGVFYPDRQGQWLRRPDSRRPEYVDGRIACALSVVFLLSDCRTCRKLDPFGETIGIAASWNFHPSAALVSGVSGQSANADGVDREYRRIINACR